MPFWEMIIIIQRRLEWPGHPCETGGAVGPGGSPRLVAGTGQGGLLSWTPPPALSCTLSIMQEAVPCIQQHLFVL